MAASDSQGRSLLEEQPRLPARGGSTRIRRFNGLTKRTHDWDGLRKDSQLWFENGDCLVHFYGYGTSQRGPSLRIPFKDVEKLDSTYLMTECLRSSKDEGQIRRVDSRLDCALGSSLATITETEAVQYELHIPAPRNVNRDEAFAFHLSTRNFFAYAVGRPVVGEKLSLALEGLWLRLCSWAPKAASASNVTAYLETQGYSNFAENPEHALACLKFAESARIHDIWIDAFAHCAGMHERLFLSPEYSGLSNTTNALITRASLEMDLHIARVVRAVRSFLEEELGTEHLGLSKPARDHLDHFRSFLHAFYVDKLGYFPPPEKTPWKKRPWKAMHHDFQCLYEYLVDSESTRDMASAKALTGGICVVQNVQAFDQRHGYDPLPHPSPLLPQQSASQRHKSSQRGLRSLVLVSGSSSNSEHKIPSKQGLAMATNCLDEDVISCHLVQEYQRFERQKLLVKLDAVEARKIRWILIYCVYQMLTSIMKAPSEVRSVERTSYPLCVLTEGCPPWTADDEMPKADSNTPTSMVATLVPDAMDALEGRTSRISIHPDCEADNAEEFFASLSGPRIDTNAHLGMAPGALRFSTPLARTASIRSSVHSSVQALHRSVVGSLSRRNSLRQENQLREPRKTRSYCEIVVEDYGNGLEHILRPAPYLTFDPSEQDLAVPMNNPLQDFDFGLGGATDEPVLESQQLDNQSDDHLDEAGIAMVASDDSDMSPRGSYFSAGSGYPTSSNRSSIQDSGIPDTDLSSCDNANRETESETSAPSTPIDFLPKRVSFIQSRQPRYKQPYAKMSTKPVSVNVGCYVPSGMFRQTAAKPIHRRNLSSQSAKSSASSCYPEESVQAADIVEEEARGRRKFRGYDRDAVKFVV